MNNYPENYKPPFTSDVSEGIREIFFNIAERDKYERIWTHPEYRKTSPAEVITDEIIRRIPKYLENRPNDKRCIIDFGCGTGRVLDHFIDDGCDVLGIDIAHNCLDEYMRQRVPLLIADLTSLPQSVQGDYGICVDVLEHIPTHQVHAAINNIARAAPQGCFIRVANFPETHGPRLLNMPLHLTLWTRQQWAQALATHFRVVQALALKEDSKPERYSFWCMR